MRRSFGVLKNQGKGNKNSRFINSIYDYWPNYELRFPFSNMLIYKIDELKDEHNLAR